LEDVPEAQKIAFLDRCAAMFHERPTTFLTQGQPWRGVFLVASGSADVTFVGPDQNRYFVVGASPGDALGELEAVADRPCAATCRTGANTTLLHCDKALFREYYRLETFQRNIMRICYDRLTRDVQRIFVDKRYTVAQKICHYILEATTQNRSAVARNQDVLASIVGCSRQTLNRTLGALRDSGLIALKRGQIEALDREGLRVRIATGKPAEDRGRFDIGESGLHPVGETRRV
jgi:CRP/FNR family transcriptional regulator, cyclic AMP receptor protein